jgi:hypothetical protein
MSANRAAGICRLGFTRYALSISVERPTFLLEMSQSPFMNKKGPDFLQFDSPWFFDPGTIRLPSPPEDRAWRRPPGAREQARWRSHTFSRPNSSVGFICSQCSVQSVMNLDEPHALVSAYTRKMMGFMLFKPSPKRIVMLGLGGGSLAKFCYRYLPKTQITVVAWPPRWRPLCAGGSTAVAERLARDEFLRRSSAVSHAYRAYSRCLRRQQAARTGPRGGQSLVVRLQPMDPSAHER